MTPNPKPPSVGGCGPGSPNRPPTFPQNNRGILGPAGGEWHQSLHTAGFFGATWPKEFGGLELPPVYDVIVDEELARAGGAPPPRPSLGYLVTGLGRHASKEVQQRFLPGMIDGTQRWCQGFSEPAPAPTSPR